ncbi:NfeD family protein [Roseibium sp. RKSG952]|uniref:NfeD family protein n=1 Tax=Roseibium sp. RKSG952 TaxID=2529384 RepID=UPI0012BB67B2|nr:NfeD family protein [Roseibium sp. RKSG952]MTI00102.1 NfeD family protein [Roseibium sp. RKSG952]
MVLRLINELGPWSWWILGLLLLALEVLAPGTIFLWFGISAILVGAVALFVDLSWQTEVIIFLVLAITSLIVGRRWVRKAAKKGGDPALNRRGSRYVGREFVLAAPISQGEGKLSIDDTVWRITGPDAPAGTRVTVIRVDGVKLVVELAAK